MVLCLENTSDSRTEWIDAHGDANTPETSPSLNYHGMPAAHLMGWFGGEVRRADGGYTIEQCKDYAVLDVGGLGLACALSEWSGFYRFFRSVACCRYKSRTGGR